MKKFKIKELFLGLILSIGLMVATSQAQPVPIYHNLTLTTGFTATDSVRVPADLVPVAVYTLDITNATSFNVQVSFDIVPTDWYTILELAAATDYSIDIADTSIAVLNPQNIMPVLGQTGTYSDDYVWFRLSGITAEAADKVFVLIFRYI